MWNLQVRSEASADTTAPLATILEDSETLIMLQFLGLLNSERIQFALVSLELHPPVVAAVCVDMGPWRRVMEICENVVFNYFPYFKT